MRVKDAQIMMQRMASDMPVILGFLCMVIGVSCSEICSQLKEIAQQLHYIDLELAALRKKQEAEQCTK